MHAITNLDCGLRKNKSNSVKPAWKRIMHLLMDYLEQSFQIMTVVIIAEIARRIFRIFHEYIKYSNYYEPEGKLVTITKRSFGMHLASSLGFIVYLFLAIICVIRRDSRPPAYFFAFIPLYWIFMSLGMGSSYLNYADWIRQPHGLDYAEGMAFNYFHGYLKLILPSHTGRAGITERMELYENKNKVKFAVKRLIILVPNTMFVHSKFESKILTKDGVMSTLYFNLGHMLSVYEISSKTINANVRTTGFLGKHPVIQNYLYTKNYTYCTLNQKQSQLKTLKPLENFIKYRAGVERPFKNDVYRFNIPINGTYYYVAMEGATPMLSFFDALNFQPSTTWQMKEMSREILLKFFKRLKYLLNKWPETQGKAELVLYNSYKPDGRPQDVGEVLLSHITNMWNEGEI